MAQTIKLKRTAVQGKIPTTSNLDLGELAINTYDGRIFFEKDVDGTLSIQEIFTTDSDVTGSLNLNGAITASSLEITGNANITGNLVLGGNITIGDASSDTIAFAGDISSSLIPDITNAFDLGSTTRKFANVYATNLYGSINSTNGVVSGSSQIDVLQTTNFSAFSSSVASTFSGLSTDYNDLQNIPSGIVSGSSQVISLLPSGTISGSSQVISLLPSGTISGSSQVTITESQISDLTHYTDSDVKTKLDADGVISGSSQVTISDTTGFTSFSSSVDTSIQTEKGRIDAILSSADADKDSFAEIVTLINSVDTTNDNAFASFYTSSNDRFDSLESFTSSIDTTIKTKLDADGVISGSSQITITESQISDLTHYTDSDVKTKLDADGVISGSSQVVIGDTDGFTSFSSSVASTFDGLSSNYDDLVGIPSGIVSGSSQLTSSFDSRYLNVSGEGNISGSFTGSFVGSFSGDGSNITNITVDAAATVDETFTNQSTVTVTHNFNSRNIIVVVYDTQNNQILPSNVNTSNLDQVVITLAGSQSGTVVVAKGGHIISGSAYDSDRLGGNLYSTYATTGSNSLVGNQEITGSLNVSGGITGSVSYTNLTDLPTLVSGSTQITDSSNLVSGSTQITDGSGLLSSSNEDFSTFSSSVDTRLDSQESFSSSFDTAINLDSSNVTILGDLTVQGTTTTTNTNQLNVGDNIIEINYGGSATTAGIYAKDPTSPNTISGSLLWDSTTDRWIAGPKDSESTILLAGGDSIVSSSAQILDGSGILSSSNEDFTTFSSSIDGRVVTLETTFSSSVDSRLDTLEGPFSTSVDSRLDNIETYTASLDITNATITGSFTGSFVGDGSGLTGIQVDQVASITASFSEQSTINVSHNFGTYNVIVSTYDSNYNQLIPQTVSLTDTNTVQVVLSSAHSGHVVVAKGGHILDTSELTSYRENVSGASFYNITHSLDEEYPFVQAWNTSNNTQEQPLDVESVNANVISVSFSANFTGKIIVKK